MTRDIYLAARTYLAHFASAAHPSDKREFSVGLYCCDDSMSMLTQAVLCRSADRRLVLKRNPAPKSGALSQLEGSCINQFMRIDLYPSRNRLLVIILVWVLYRCCWSAGRATGIP